MEYAARRLPHGASMTTSPKAVPATVLEGVRVLELASFVAAPFCSKLLGDMGADVIKIEEPPSGDVARTRGPFPGDIPHTEKSGLFLYLNTNKASVTVNPGDPAGSRIVKALLQEVDVLVHDRSPSVARALGLEYESLRSLNPSLVVTPITPFGQTGPYSGYKAHALNICHAGGEGYVLPGGPGYRMFPHEPPVRTGGHSTDYDAGLTAALGTMMALLARQVWGVGQLVDVSRQEAEITLNRVSFVTWFSEQKIVRRENRFYTIGGMFNTSDGEVVLRPTENNHWRGLCEVMGRPELAEHPRYNTRELRVANGAEVQDIISAWASRHTKQEVYEACLAAGCPVGPAASAEDVYLGAQTKAREFFKPVGHPEAGSWDYPTVPYQFSETPWAVRRPAPALGQHNREVLAGMLGLAAGELEILRANGAI